MLFGDRRRSVISCPSAVVVSTVQAYHVDRHPPSRTILPTWHINYEAVSTIRRLSHSPHSSSIERTEREIDIARLWTVLISKSDTPPASMSL